MGHHYRRKVPKRQALHTLSLHLSGPTDIRIADLTDLSHSRRAHPTNFAETLTRGYTTSAGQNDIDPCIPSLLHSVFV